MGPSRIKLGLSNDPTALLVNSRMSSGFCGCKIYIPSLPEKFTPKDANVTVFAFIMTKAGMQDTAADAGEQLGLRSCSMLDQK